MEYAYIHPDLQPFVISQLASVIALITRFGWVDIEEYEHVYKDMNQFLSVSLLCMAELNSSLYFECRLLLIIVLWDCKYYPLSFKILTQLLFQNIQQNSEKQVK